MRLNVSMAGFCCLFWSSAFAQDATPAEREQEVRARIAQQSGYGKTTQLYQVERVIVPQRVERPVRESAPPPFPRAELEEFRVPVVPMKRVDGPRAPRFVRVTPEQYAAFAAEYQGNVKLFRLAESEIAINATLLGELLETAATALRTNESARVKYYTGISHSLHGVMVQGSSRDPSVPPPRGVYYHEFHEDNAGRVRAVVGNDTDGSRYVTDVLLYDQGRPYARLYYNRAGEFQQAVMVYYRGDQPYLTCRVGRGGTTHMELANAPVVVTESR